MKILICTILLSVFSLPSIGSDHIDGPATMKHKVGDLVDLYAFKAHENNDKLVVILNTYPLVGKSGHFSKKIDYKILIKEVVANGPKFDVAGSELAITCSFKTPWNHSKHTGTCTTSNGASSTTKMNEVSLRNENNDFRLFVGKRSDPFFFNGTWATSVSTKGIIPKAKDDNIMAKVNTLSMVLEIDLNKVFPEAKGRLFGISAESVAKDKNGQTRILDRLGRPEITNVSLVAHKNETDLRDMFNNERSFSLAKENQDIYAERLRHNIKYYDGLDKTDHWSKEERKELANILVDDFLVIDLSKNCEKESFFSIEKSLLKGDEWTTCGGRLIEDDIMDTLFTLYINADKGPRMADGVSAPYKTPLKHFPYLAKPVTGFGAWSKIQIAKLVLFFKNLF